MLFAPKTAFTDGLKDKLVVITGGGSGMGLGMAKAFAEDGAKVVVTGRHKDKLDEAAKEHENISSFVCDVAKDEDMIKLRDEMEAKGGVDFLVNNAGVIHMFDIKDESYDINKEFQEVNIDINGVIRGVHYFLPQMKKKETATIMNVSSALAYVPWAAAPVYCATKAFVHSYTTSLRISLRNTTVKVVELLPPAVKTPMTGFFDEEMKKGFDMMELDDFIAAVRKGLNDGVDEITPGQASQLKMMSRIAPGFIIGQVNAKVS